MADEMSVAEVQGLLNEKLDADIVQHRLDYGQYVHLKVQNLRQKSRAWTTIHKIFNESTLKEVDGWFYCTECNDHKVFTKDISNGTGPLLMHQKKHADERKQTDSLRQAAATAVLSLPNTNTNTNSVSSEETQKSATVHNGTQTDQCGKYHIIGEDELPVVLARLTNIIHRHGPLSERDFRAILPECGKWSSDWLETVLQIAETQRFTVNLNRIRPDNAPETQTRKRARRGNQNATSKKPRVTRPKKK